MVEKTPFKVDAHHKTLPGTPPGARKPRGTWQLVREGADHRNISLRTQEETEVRTRVATMKRVARGRRSGTGPTAAGRQRVRVARGRTTAVEDGGRLRRRLENVRQRRGRSEGDGEHDE